MQDLDERSLLRRAQQGDKAAFGEVVRRQQTAVFNVAYRLTGRRQDAEDAAQEAFLRAYRALDRFDLERPFGPWVKRICTNLCLNWLSAKQQQTQTAAADISHARRPRVDMDHWAAPAGTPEQAVVRQEQTQRLRAAITQLPPQQRAVVELRHFQELSYDEIAAALERSLSSVKSDLFRGRKKLAALLRQETAEPNVSQQKAAERDGDH